MTASIDGWAPMSTDDYFSKKHAQVVALAARYGVSEDLAGAVKADVTVLANALIAIAEDHDSSVDPACWCKTCAALRMVLPELAARYAALAKGERRPRRNGG